jgi:hypothetical protein
MKNDFCQTERFLLVSVCVTTVFFDNNESIHHQELFLTPLNFCLIHSQVRATDIFYKNAPVNNTIYFAHCRYVSFTNHYFMQRCFLNPS